MEETTIPTPTLDAIHLDEFKHTQPSGQVIAPHKGQTVWVYGYGRGSDETARFQARLGAAQTPDEQLDVTAAFLAGEIAKWTLCNARTGEPYGPPTAETVKTLPDALFLWLAQKIMGSESAGKGGAASGS